MPRWTTQQIRAARKAPLPALLTKRGILLRELEADNFTPADHPGLILKDSYWHWPERHLGGNTIDYFILILGLDFNQSMQQIAPHL